MVNHLMNHTNTVSDHDISKLVGDVERSMREQVLKNDAALYHLACGGGRVRAISCIEVCFAIGLDPRSSTCLATSVELLHNASLIHDDLQDNDPTRRGKPAAWHEYGKNAAICAGDLLIAKAFGELANFPDITSIPSLLTHVQEAVSLTIEGQNSDNHASDCDSLEEYEKIAASKSGPLLRLPIELPLMAAGYNEAIDVARKAISRFAVAYQIADDLCDWRSDEVDGQLNIVNILAMQMSRREALDMAQTRAQHLLKSCQIELRKLPAGSGRVFVDLANGLLQKVMSNDYE